MSKNTLETAWRRQKQWSERANRFKISLTYWRLMVLGLSIFAAVCATVSGFLEQSSLSHRITSFLIAVSAALAPIFAKFRLSRENTSRWIRARSASEAFKSEIFQFRTRTGDYAGQNAMGNFSSATRRISESVEDILSTPLSEPTVENVKLSDLSIDEYLEIRVKNQIDNYYRPKSNYHAQKAAQFRNAHFFLMLFGAILGALSIFVEVGIGPWVAVITTITSSLLAYAAAGRHDELTIGFRATANRLEEIHNNWKDKILENEPTEKQGSALVVECEEVISSENQSWNAKFSKEQA